jgi:hypothetical protein
VLVIVAGLNDLMDFMAIEQVRDSLCFFGKLDRHIKLLPVQHLQIKKTNAIEVRTEKPR